jgi:hypothetical protein
MFLINDRNFWCLGGKEIIEILRTVREQWCNIKYFFLIALLSLKSCLSFLVCLPCFHDFLVLLAPSM